MGPRRGTARRVRPSSHQVGGQRHGNFTGPNRPSRSRERRVLHDEARGNTKPLKSHPGFRRLGPPELEAVRNYQATRLKCAADSESSLVRRSTAAGESACSVTRHPRFRATRASSAIFGKCAHRIDPMRGGVDTKEIVAKARAETTRT